MIFKKKQSVENISKPRRRLSFLRLLIAVLLITGISYATVKGAKTIEQSQTVSEVKPWFAPYVDVTATPLYSFEQSMNNNTNRNLMLAFIVSLKDDGCTPSWGSVYTMDQAEKSLDLDRRIARLRQQKGNIAISFGGLLNDELSVSCTDKEKLKEAYLSVVDRYQIDTIDLDIEGEDLRNNEALTRQAETIAEIQKEFRAENKSLAVWLTLPVAPQGLTQDGTNVVAKFLDSGVDLAGVNLMTMDYGASRDNSQTMAQASEQALVETQRQLSILFDNAGIHLNDASVWKKIGATPMIGQNDIQGEIFTPDDAKNFNEFVLSKGITRLSFWSANRDIECGENYVNITIVSDSCSGVKQDKNYFTETLGLGFSGDITSNSYQITSPDPKTLKEADDPSKSPYQIWNEDSIYLEGTKIVWHKNVYQAKWWTQGDLPDNPVLQSWETPWKLIGPVLPGESPIPQPTLEPGTYPKWSGIEIYESGERVLFNGVPYQAKWWTQGDSPAASSSNPDASPWIALTQEQVEKLKSN